MRPQLANSFMPVQTNDPQGGALSDAFANLRMQNLFQPQNPIQQGPQTFGAAVQGVPITPEQPPFQAHEYGLPQFDTRAQERLYQLLNKFPERNQPGLGRKILSSIVGAAGGPQAADQTMYAPYYRQMQDWQAQFGPTEKAADNERMSNVNLRSLAYNIAQDRNYQERLRIQDADQRRKEISTKAYAAFKQFQIDHPGFTIESPRGGNYQLFNKATGERIDSGYPTGTMDRMQEMEFQRETNKQVAAVPRTVNTTGTTTTTTQTSPGSEEPSQRKVREYSRARELYNNPVDAQGNVHPEWKDLIHLDVPEPGSFIVDNPALGRKLPILGQVGGSTDQEWNDYKYINKKIYEESPASGGSTSTSISNRRSVTSRDLPQTVNTNQSKATTDKLRANFPVARGAQYDRGVATGVAGANANRAIESQQGAERRAAAAKTQADAANRERAIQILKDAGEEVDEANIQEVMRQKGWLK